VTHFPAFECVAQLPRKGTVGYALLALSRKWRSGVAAGQGTVRPRMLHTLHASTR
jgi:hypothetical protein